MSRADSHGGARPLPFERPGSAGLAFLGALLIALLVLLLLWPSSSRAGAIPPFGNALKLDGTDDYANISDNSSLDLGVADGEDFTIEAFVYVPDTTNTTTDVFFYKG